MAPSGRALCARWPPPPLRGSTKLPKLGKDPKKLGGGCCCCCWIGLGLSATGNRVTGWGCCVCWGRWNSGLWKLKKLEDCEPASCTTVFRIASKPRPVARPGFWLGSIWLWGLEAAGGKLLKAVKGRKGCWTCWGRWGCTGWGSRPPPKMVWSWGCWGCGGLGGGCGGCCGGSGCLGCWGLSELGPWSCGWGGNWSRGSWGSRGSGSRRGLGVLGNDGKFLEK